MKNQLYKIHCHQCDNEFMASGMLLRGLYDYSLLMFTRECPNSGSHRFMPEMFEDDEIKKEWRRVKRKLSISQRQRFVFCLSLPPQTNRHYEEDNHLPTSPLGISSM